MQIHSVSRLSSHQVTKTPLISYNWLDFTNELKREVDSEMTNFQKEKLSAVTYNRNSLNFWLFSIQVTPS